MALSASLMNRARRDELSGDLPAGELDFTVNGSSVSLDMADTPPVDDAHGSGELVQDHVALTREMVYDSI